MATTHPLPAQVTENPRHTETPRQLGETGGENAEEQGLVPVPAEEEAGNHLELSVPMALLPVEMDVAVPLRNFRVRDLLALEPGRIIESQWGHGEDVPLAAGDVQLAWSEFEVIETQLAVRVTRLM